MSRAKEQGVALIVALVLLLVITLLGVAGVQNVTLEEKMAGASQERQVAFQVAEAELRLLEGSVAAGTFPANGCDQGWCATQCGVTNDGRWCAFSDTGCSVCYRDKNFTHWSPPVGAPSNSAFCRRFLVEKVDSYYRVTVAVWRNPSSSSCENTNSMTQSGSLVVLQSLTPESVVTKVETFPVSCPA